jgi:hypothetical protein
MQKRMVTIGVAACVLALIVAGLSTAQQQGGRQRGGNQGDRQGPQGQQGQRGQFDPEQMRQRMAERMKEQLGVDDAAWKVMEPRLQKVMDLSRQAGGGGRGMMFGMMGGPGGQRPGQEGRGPGGQQRELSPVEKAMEQLQTTLDNPSASPEEIKKQLTALRTAREKARQELATAQQSLREILTVRQEAQLVRMGMLD